LLVIIYNIKTKSKENDDEQCGCSLLFTILKQHEEGDDDEQMRHNYYHCLQHLGNKKGK
jgi:hypothetical protein